MLEAGLRDDQISQVRGFADQRLLLANDPANPSNRRISIIVRNQDIDAQEDRLTRPSQAPPAAKAPPGTKAE